MVHQSQRVVRMLQIVGGCLFVTAYFLPGISFPDAPHSLIGYKCALNAVTFACSGTLEVFRGKQSWSEIWIPVLAGLSALNNLLAPMYVLVKKMRKRSLAVAVVICCVATPCAVLYAVNERPLVGCYLWMLGAILLLAPEVNGSMAG